MNNPKRILRLLTLIIFSAILSANVMAAPKVELRLESSSRSGAIETGQKFYIKIIVSNLNESPAAPANVPGAKVQYFGHQSSSSSFSSVNGVTSQSIVNIYAITCKAEKTGKFSFGPVTLGGVKSNVLNYQIVDAGSSPDYSPSPGSSGSSSAAAGNDPNANGPTFIGKGNERLFLRASLNKTTAYEQEALVYTVKLYTTYGSIKFIGATDAPKFEGFVIEESNQISNQLSYETYQGQTYATAIIARYIIFPQMTGDLKIIGNKYTVSTDAEEYYHDPFFSQLTVRRPIQLNVSPNDLTVKVRALPSPKPANFSGGVGKFTISSNLKSEKAVANQAGSITYSVTGEGNLKYINLPDLNALYPDEIEVFTPTTNVKTVVGGSNVSGTVKFDYSFMPLEQGRFNLPAVELVYFNPTTEKYETSTSRAYTLDVARGAESSKSQAALSYNSKLMPVTLPAPADQRPMISGFLYWLWYIMPVMALLGAYIGNRHYLALQSDIAGLRSRRAGKMARRRLKAAMNRLKEGKEELFYDEMLKALWGYLADKLKLPTSELNRENVGKILGEHSITDETVTSLLNLIDECEFAKYSPSASHRSMQDVYDDGAEILNRLEEEFSNQKPATEDENK